MEYPVLNKYLKANPSSTIDQLFAMEDAIRYAKRLKGTTLDDIYNAKTERALYAIASALEIVAYTSKSKKHLRELCIEKYNRVFNSVENIELPVLTDIDETIIQSELEIGPPAHLTSLDEHDLKDYISEWDIQFEKDNNDDYVIPTQTSLWDFFRPTASALYKGFYRNLKFYKGRYYQFMCTDNKWHQIDSLEEPIKDLFMVVLTNMRSLSTDMMNTFIYVEKRDKLIQCLRRKVLKSMEQVVKLHSKTVTLSPIMNNNRVQEKQCTECMCKSIVYDVIEEALLNL